jgi:CrcB protein
VSSSSPRRLKDGQHGMERFLWICLAGAAGTGARYLIALWAAQRLGSAFPYGTLIVNLVGCFAIAALMHAALTLGWSPSVRAAVTIGFIGGLTTYSSFNYETMRLFEESAPATAVVNVALTMLGGLMAGWLGLVASRQVLGR